MGTLDDAAVGEHHPPILGVPFRSLYLVPEPYLATLPLDCGYQRASDAADALLDFDDSAIRQVEGRSAIPRRNLAGERLRGDQQLRIDEPPKTYV